MHISILFWKQLSEHVGEDDVAVCYKNGIFFHNSSFYVHFEHTTINMNPVLLLHVQAMESTLTDNLLRVVTDSVTMLLETAFKSYKYHCVVYCPCHYCRHHIKIQDWNYYSFQEVYYTFSSNISLKLTLQEA